MTDQKKVVETVVVINLNRLLMFVQVFLGVACAAFFLIAASRDLATGYLNAIWPLLYSFNAYSIYKLNRYASQVRQAAEAYVVAMGEKFKAEMESINMGSINHD